MAHPSPTLSDATRARLRLRRNPLWLLAGVVAICLGGLASAFLYLSVADTQPVLATTRTVYRGELIAQDDLSVIPIAAGVELRTIPGDRLTEVVGKAAQTDIPSGSLVVEGTFGDSSLSPGQVRVGLRLAAGRLPGGDLLPGTPVLIVALPAAQGATVESDGLPASVQATLLGAGVAQPDGSVVVDVTVPAERAEQVARLAAADRVAVVQQGTSR